MVDSKHTNAHVHSVFKIDMSRIARIREKEKSKYEQRNGVKLTYMPFIARAAIVTLRKMRIVNASLQGRRFDRTVIMQAEERNFLGIARAIADLAEAGAPRGSDPRNRIRNFHYRNSWNLRRAVLDIPVINMPESSILGVGGLFKEPAVVTDENGYDAIAIRHVIRLTLGFDHRIIDGADAGEFMAELRKYLEHWNEEIG